MYLIQKYSTNEPNTHFPRFEWSSNTKKDHSKRKSDHNISHYTL